MRKILLISSIIFGGILFAQKSKFSNNYSKTELVKIQKTIPENQKQDFYKQYFRAKIFEEMKHTFKYKNYSEIVLKKFIDSVVAGNCDENNVDFENNSNQTFVPSQTFEEFLKRHNDYISQDENSLRNGLKRFGNLLNEKEISDMVSPDMNRINDEKLKTPETLKKEYEDEINLERENYENDPISVEGRKKLIKKIDQNFANRLQDSDENYQLLSENIGLISGQTFPQVTSEPEEGSMHETIPGEILTYVTENGYAAGRHYVSYKIDKDKIIPINPIPYENKQFKSKVSKYVKGEWRFEDRAGYDIKKNKVGEYVITTSLYKEDDPDCCPSMAIEFKTKDFKNFVPLRISKGENKWKIIK